MGSPKQTPISTSSPNGDVAEGDRLKVAELSRGVQGRAGIFINLIASDTFNEISCFTSYLFSLI